MTFYLPSSKITVISTEKSQNILVEISLFLTFVKISRSSVKNAQNRYIGITSKLACSLFGNKTKAVDFHSGQWGFRECCTDQIISSWLLVLWYENLTRKIIACAARYKRPINPMLKKIQMDTSDLCLMKKNQIFIFSLYILERFFKNIYAAVSYIFSLGLAIFIAAWNTIDSILLFNLYACLTLSAPFSSIEWWLDLVLNHLYYIYEQAK